MEFPDEKQETTPIEIVSSTWVFEEDGQDFCYWPSYLKSNFKKFLKLHLPIEVEKCEKTLVSIKYETCEFSNTVC